MFLCNDTYFPLSFFFFFFQAEDGIRDHCVTGVQTCALPISINGQMYGGMLLGKIGEDGEAFTIGERYEGTPEAQGKLYLHIGPSPWNAQSQGSYDVKIARKN